MYSYKVTKIFFLSASILLASYNLWSYFEYDSVIARKDSITYKVINTSVHGGRGFAYYMQVLYNAEKYNIHITQAVYDSIQVNKLPILYFSSKMHVVFSPWQKTKSLRLVGLGLFGVVVSLFIFNPSRYR